MLDSLKQPQWAKKVPFLISNIYSISFTINSKPGIKFDIVLEISDLKAFLEYVFSYIT